MKNKFNETGSDFGNIKSLTKSGSESSNLCSRKEQINKLKNKWPYPEKAKKLLVQLLELVSSKEEHEQLQKDLAELEILISFNSSKVKGGTA